GPASRRSVVGVLVFIAVTGAAVAVIIIPVAGAAVILVVLVPVPGPGVVIILIPVTRAGVVLVVAVAGPAVIFVIVTIARSAVVICIPGSGPAVVLVVIVRSAVAASAGVDLFELIYVNCGQEGITANRDGVLRLDHAVKEQRLRCVQAFQEIDVAIDVFRDGEEIEKVLTIQAGESKGPHDLAVLHHIEDLEFVDLLLELGVVQLHGFQVGVRVIVQRNLGKGSVLADLTGLSLTTRI